MTQIDMPESMRAARQDLLDNIYVSNVKNNLRELTNPTENYRQRWIYELCQNAKDSISGDRTRQSVDVIVQADDSRVMFKHNGSPFTSKAMLGLLYKYSQGKENTESVGRFGTGFLTTHCLSKEVEVSGDLFMFPNDKETCGFCGTMYRDGETSAELLEGVKKMDASLRFTSETKDWTILTYKLKTDQNRESMIKGIRNFRENVIPTMLFCPEFSTITLEDHEETVKFIRVATECMSGEIYKTSFEIERGNTSKTRILIHTSTEEACQELSIRYKKDRSLRIAIAIEVDETGNVLEQNPITPSLFYAFPLVGAEALIMPILLNSPDFEPATERDCLLLNGDETRANDGVISDIGINRLILAKSVHLFRKIVSHLSANNQCLFRLLKGLKNIPSVHAHFDEKWFHDKVMIPYREVLREFEIVETASGRQKLFDPTGKPKILFLIAPDSAKQLILYDLFHQIYSPACLPLKEENAKWTENVWNECGKSDVRTLCRFVEEKKKLDCLELQPSSSFTKIQWINSLFEFIIEIDRSILTKFQIIPNMLKQFVVLDAIKLTDGKTLTEFSIQCLNDLGEDLRPTMMHNDITSITLPIKITLEDLALRIDHQIKNIVEKGQRENQRIETIIAKVHPLLSIVPDDDQLYPQKFLTKQKNIASFSLSLFPGAFNKVVNNDIPSNAWPSLHHWIVPKLITNVSSHKQLSSLPMSNPINWMNSFLTFVMNEVIEGYLDSSANAIIPNQKGIFCPKSQLFSDGIADVFKTQAFEKYGIRFAEILLHREITSLRISQVKDISDVIRKILKVFSGFKFSNLYSGYS
jgi:hypothetical protein